MRTMLIPIILVLICSQYLPADAKKFADCNKLIGFKCFVPKMCKSTATPVKVKDNGVEEIFDNDDVSNDCPAIFRYYPYTPQWAHFEMEGLKKETKKIYFHQFETDENLQKLTKNEFTCERIISGSKKEMKATRKYGTQTDIMMIKPDAEILKCTFEVRSKKKGGVDEGIFGKKHSDSVVFGVNDENSDEELALYLSLERCDPLKLKFVPEVNKDRVYRKVEYDLDKPGNYYCKDSEIFEMEYQSQRQSGIQYYSVVKIECRTNKFEIQYIGADNNLEKDSISTETPVRIRCAADVKYFCDYEPEGIPGRPKLGMIPPDYKSKKARELKCPLSAEFLVLRGKVERNPQIECVNYEDTQYWTINKIDTLSKTFTEAYCTDKLNCNQENKMVVGGIVQLDSDGLPKCPVTGILQVNGKAVTIPTCDTQTGKFMYTFTEDGSGEKKPVLTGSEFSCYLPPQKDEAKDAANNQLMAITGSVSIVAVVLIVAATNITVFFISRKRLEALKAKKAQLEKEKRQQNMNDGVFMKLCYTKKEKAALENGLDPEKRTTKTVIREGKKVKIAEYGELDAKDAAPKSEPRMDAGIKWGNVVMDHVSKYESRFKEEVVDAPESDFVLRPEMEKALVKKSLNNPKEITNPLFKMPELRRVKPEGLIGRLETENPFPFL